MNRTITTSLLAICLLAIPLVAKCQQKVKENGTWWNSWPDSEKVLYIAGYVDGIETGREMAGSRGLKARPNAPAGCTSAMLMDFHNIQIGQLEEGTDTFYKDFRNTQIPVPSALLYVRDQISGCSESVLAQEIAVLRQMAASGK